MGSLPCTSCVIQQPVSHVMARPGQANNCLFPALNGVNVVYPAKETQTDLLSDSSDVWMLRTQLDIPDDRQAPEIIYSNFN